MNTRIQKWGNSQGVRIPKHILALGSLSEGSEVEITVESGDIVIRKAVKRSNDYTIQQLFAGYKGETRFSEEEWGGPEGREEI